MAIALETVVKQLSDSGIVTPAKLENFVPPKAAPKDAEALLRELFKQNLLTKFQAQQCAAGKAKSLILGNYTLLDKIGAGGMGQVFKAQHRRMERLVAIKTLPTAMMKDPATVARFEREVKAAARLTHPNIVAAHDADESNGTHFLVMEFVEGQDLSALVKKNGAFPVAKAVNYILQAARGLEFAHGEGVVHRDIKPANLLLDKKGTVKILDMGLARIESDGTAATQAELTSSGTVMGTVDYMAPEQAMSTKNADARADIYSLGCTLHYLIAAKPTYEGETMTAKLIAHQAHPIPDLRKESTDVSEDLEAIFKKMMAKKIEDRYQSMTEVIADLERLGTGQSTSASIQQTMVTKSNNEKSSSDFSLNFDNTMATKAAKTSPAKKAAAAKSGKNNNKKLALIGGAVVLGLLLVAAVIVSLKTKEGTLTVEVDQSGATVEVLDDKGVVKVTNRSRKGKPLKISVHPGKYRLKVEKGGFTIFGDEFEMASGGTKEITAKLVPLEAAPAVANNSSPPQSYPPGKFGLQFDGTQSVETEAVPPMSVVECTIEAWLSLAIPSISQTAVRIALLPDERSINLLNGARFDFYTFHKNVSSPEGSAESNRRVHLAGVSDGKQRRLYLNGKRVGEIADAGQLHPTLKASAPLQIGGHRFAGTIDTVRISSIVRYTQDFSPPTSFKPDKDTFALYLFNEGQGNQLKDSSSNGYHGKIKGAKWVKLDGTAASAKQKLAYTDPAFPAWVKQVQAMSAEEQLKAVSNKLMELNPGFDGKLTNASGKGKPPIHNGAVVELWLDTGTVSDISPVRALAGLKSLLCTGVGGKSMLSDLSPLQGMNLNVLQCWGTPISDLSPLKGMNLTSVTCHNTPVSSLLALEECKSLTTLNVRGTNVTFASVAALQKVLPNCKIEWDEPAKIATPKAVVAVGPQPPLAKAPFDAAQATAHQAAWAKYLGVPVEFENSLRMKFMLIPPGEFQMGVDPQEIDVDKLKIEEKNRQRFQDKVAGASPRHPIRITRPFYLQADEVTIGQYRELIGTLPQDPLVDATKPNRALSNYVMLADGVAFCQALSEREAKTPAYQTAAGVTTRVLAADGYRLPTEAEWEYSCRAGTTTLWFFGDNPHGPQAYKGYAEVLLSYQGPSDAIAPPKPNPFGLRYMYAGSTELCYDRFTPYTSEAIVDPFSEPSDGRGIRRGGSSSASGGKDMTDINSFARTNGPNNAVDSKWHGLGRVLLPIPVPSTKTPGATTSSSSNPKSEPWNTPAFQAWVKSVQAMPAEKQTDEVKKKLSELNPGFDGTLTPKFQNNVLTELTFVSDGIADISPVRALAGLKTLKCDGSNDAKSVLSDLSPLQGMPLTNLSCGNTAIADLNPLRGMLLTRLVLYATSVSDLSPLAGMPLANLNIARCHQISDLTALNGMPLTQLLCDSCRVSDVSPLRGMPLTQLTAHALLATDLSPLKDCKSLKSLRIQKTKATRAEVAALQKALPECVIEADDLQ